MTDLVATTPGVFPLPDWAKEDLGRLKGHQKHDLISDDEEPDVTAVYDEARAEVLTAQEDAELDRIVEGQLRWDDMLAHPLCVHDAVETGGLERYYDNNNFYREPVVVDALDFDGDLAADLEAATGAGVDFDRLQPVVPGPYSLFDLATDEHYGDDRAFLDALASFLGDEVAAFPRTGTCVVLEPSLVTTPPDRDLAEPAAEAISHVAAATDAEVVVHTYWGGLEADVHSRLLDADVDAIGYDLVTAGEANRALIAEYGTTPAVALGVVDGQNTLVETPETVRERVRRVTEDADSDVETVYLTSNTELFYLPVNRFEEKLAVLGEAARTEEVVA